MWQGEPNGKEIRKGTWSLSVGYLARRKVRIPAK